ncbi:putative transposase [Pseudomonas saponiphila]|uniref:Putative transposase n=1 Tax=Pseudomonas saponiphila TaxID=556534 RepID=A0A1H4QU80_9PSED|nr:DNA-binding protein [Pseudomonas saponiphila]SEC23098.1 putative transposase [Pseudomonas saponiphila]SEC26446.1 putative transposase [Pseudomonas saponiphila]
MRNWYSAQELAGLPGLPSTSRNVKAMAARENWEGQQRLGSKAVEYSFAMLPEKTQAALIAASIPASAPEAPAETHVILSGCDAKKASRLNDSQISVMTARLSFVREIERMSKVVSQNRAILTLVSLARTGDLSPYLAEQVVRANDRKTEDRTLSERTLKRWLADYRAHGEMGLAPARRKQDMSVPSWAAEFLKHYQRPQKPSVEAAYEQFKQIHSEVHSSVCPSIHAVRRWLKKLSPEARERGRMGPHELKTLQAYNRRKADMLWPNDVWVADGHTFDAEVINPLTGQIFRPEITMIIDWGTRRITGFSVNLAESTLATLDTLRDGVTRCGMYKIFYVDNGSGFDNAVVYEANDRLGGTVTHSLPYNSQARGVIERPHKTILVRLAKTFDSYIGADMDKEAGTKAHKLSRKQLALGLAPTVVPEFSVFFADLQCALDDYNRRPHRGLPKFRDPQTLRMRHQSPMEAWKQAEAEGWEPLLADASIVESLTRPQVLRTARRAQVQWNSGTYFLKELEGFHGEEVRVAYDFRDSSRVWVHTLDGELIGEAILDGNASPAMPVTMLEKASEKRERGQLSRLVKKAKTITGQDVEMRVIPTASSSYELSPAQLAEAQRFAQLVAPQAPAFEIPNDPISKYRLWQQLDGRVKGGEALPPEQAQWHERWPKHSDYSAMQRMFAHAEQARA